MSEGGVMGLPPGTEEIFLLAGLITAYLIFRFVLPFLVGRLIGKVPALFARRYLFSRSNRNAVNIISFISVLGISVVTAAFILVLSVFNGFQAMVEDMYTAFDPDIRVTPAQGKYFPASDSLKTLINGTEGVAYTAGVVEDRAMITFNDRQRMGVVKGLPGDYLKINPVDSLLYNGDYIMRTVNGSPMTVLGGSLAYQLQTEISDRRVSMYAVAHDKDLMKDPENAVTTIHYYVAGYFKVQLEYDSKFALVDLASAQKLFGVEDEITAYEIRVENFRQSEKVKNAIADKLGPDWRVETWYEIHKGLFDVMKNEKLVAYLILTLMLLIAAVNIVGSLSMIVMEKTRDIAIIRSYGAERKHIRRIFLGEGLYVGAIGGIAGVLLAYVAMLAHLKYGFLPFEGGEAFNEMSVFPFKLWWGDFVVTFLTVFVMAVGASLYPAAKAASRGIVESLRK